METFKASHARLLLELMQRGWHVKPGLKVPHATSPDGNIRLWFKAQAVYMSVGNAHSFAGARSLWVETRGLATSELVSHAETFSRLDAK
jgi:hypothetical protein